MKKLIFIFFSVLLVATMVACSNSKETSDEIPKMLNVDLTIHPEKGKVNQPIIFEAKVTQGSENVNDADKVIFEIWRSKAEKHEKIQVKHAKNGVYSLKKIFDQEGTYYVISHVTARGMHNMPKKEFVIGNPSEKENTTNSMADMDMDSKQDK